MFGGRGRDAFPLHPRNR